MDLAQNQFVIANQAVIGAKHRSIDTAQFIASTLH